MKPNELLNQTETSEEKQLFYEPCMDNTPVPPTSRDYSLLSPHYSKLKNRSRYKIDQKYFKSASNSSNTLLKPRASSVASSVSSVTTISTGSPVPSEQPINEIWKKKASKLNQRKRPIFYNFAYEYWQLYQWMFHEPDDDISDIIIEFLFGEQPHYKNTKSMKRKAIKP